MPLLITFYISFICLGVNLSNTVMQLAISNSGEEAFIFFLTELVASLCEQIHENKIQEDGYFAQSDQSIINY